MFFYLLPFTYIVDINMKFMPKNCSYISDVLFLLISAKRILYRSDKR